jgi:hypothetical protein
MAAKDEAGSTGASFEAAKKAESFSDVSIWVQYEEDATEVSYELYPLLSMTDINDLTSEKLQDPYNMEKMMKI